MRKQGVKRRSHEKMQDVVGSNKMKKNPKRGIRLSRKRREHKRNKTRPSPVQQSTLPILHESQLSIEPTMQDQSMHYKESTSDDSEHESSEDDRDTIASLTEITEKIKGVDIFSSASGVDHVDMITTCWCAGLRVHTSCAQKLDIPDGIPLCLFDGGPYGVCTSDCISCVPCIVCHKVRDNDTHTSLSRDFPVGDNWLLREERACPSCLAKIHGDKDEVRCKFCNVGYEENVGFM